MKFIVDKHLKNSYVSQSPKYIVVLNCNNQVKHNLLKVLQKLNSVKIKYTYFDNKPQKIWFRKNYLLYGNKKSKI